MASIFRDSIVVIYIDEDNNEILRVADTRLLPRVGENVRIRSVPYLVDRVGYDLPEGLIERVWIVLRPA